MKAWLVSDGTDASAYVLAPTAGKAFSVFMACREDDGGWPWGSEWKSVTKRRVPELDGDAIHVYDLVAAGRMWAQCMERCVECCEWKTISAGTLDRERSGPDHLYCLDRERGETHICKGVVIPPAGPNQAIVLYQD